MGRYNIHTKAKLTAYFINRLGMFKYKHGWLKGTCPSCMKELKYGVNVSLNRTNCFVCGYSLKPLDVAMSLENLDYHGILKFLDNGSFDGIEYKEEVREVMDYKTFYLPEGFKLLTKGDSQLARSARSYIKSRGFDINKMTSKGWGYCGSGPYFGYIVMPFINKGKLVYYNARNFLSTGPRYNNPNLDITGVGKQFIWYNLDAFYMYNMVYLTEGVFNAETMGDKGVASGGKFLSKYQINEIIKSPVKAIVILLDPDAKDKALKLALELIDYKKVKVVFLPDGEDPNSLGYKKTMQYIYKTRFQDRQALYKLKNELL